MSLWTFLISPKFLLFVCLVDNLDVASNLGLDIAVEVLWVLSKLVVYLGILFDHVDGLSENFQFLVLFNMLLVNSSGSSKHAKSLLEIDIIYLLYIFLSYQLLCGFSRGKRCLLLTVNLWRCTRS